jgi:3-oxoacyl-[acyl-carrier-protein] synthase-3
MDIGLSEIAVMVPDSRDQVAGILARSGADAFTQRLFTGMYKLSESPSWDEEDTLDGLLIDVGRRVPGHKAVNLVLYGHTLSMQEAALRPDFVRGVRAGLGLAPSVPFYGISGVGCASLLRSLEVGSQYLRAASEHGDVLVLGADMGSAIEAGRIVPQMTVMGDSAVALTLSRENYRYRYLGSAVRKDLRFHKGVRMTMEESREFARQCVDLVVGAMEAAMTKAGLTLQDVDWVMPHLANAMLWSSFARRSGIPHQRIVLDLISSDGHTYGTDALKSLRSADDSGRLKAGDRCALVSIGQGFYIHVAVVEVVGEDR